MAMQRPAPLMVPDAELLAKNMRAESLMRKQLNEGGFIQTEEQRSGRKLAYSPIARHETESEDYGSAGTSGDVGQRKIRKFGKAIEEDKGPGFVERIRLSLGIEEGESWGKAVWPVLEKGASAVSKLPEPTTFFLGIVWILMIIRIVRRSLLDSWIVTLSFIAAMNVVIVMSALWGKTNFFAALREGQYKVKAYPEEKLDELEAELKEREEKVKAKEVELTKNREQLELLKKELELDPVKDAEHRVVKPSKKAVEIIAKGALGTSYDAQGTEAAELRKKKEAVLKSREHWKLLPPEAEDAGVKEKLQKHSATRYKERTKQLKENANVQKAGGVLAVAGGLRLPFTNKEKGKSGVDHQVPAQPHPIYDVPSSASILRPQNHRRNSSSAKLRVSHDSAASSRHGASPAASPSKKLKRRGSSIARLFSKGSRRSSRGSSHKIEVQQENAVVDTTGYEIGVNGTAG